MGTGKSKKKTKGNENRIKNIIKTGIKDECKKELKSDTSNNDNKNRGRNWHKNQRRKMNKRKRNENNLKSNQTSLQPRLSDNDTTRTSSCSDCGKLYHRRGDSICHVQQLRFAYDHLSVRLTQYQHSNIQLMKEATNLKQQLSYQTQAYEHWQRNWPLYNTGFQNWNSNWSYTPYQNRQRSYQQPLMMGPPIHWTRDGQNNYHHHYHYYNYNQMSESAYADPSTSFGVNRIESASAVDTDTVMGEARDDMDCIL